jgi:hypothetical protein
MGTERRYCRNWLIEFRGHGSRSVVSVQDEGAAGIMSSKNAPCTLGRA